MGMVDLWKEVVEAGHLAAGVKGVKNVVNDIISKEFEIEKTDKSGKIQEVKNNGLIELSDVLIIGGGVSGCAVARALSQYELNILLVEKNSDISEEATKANIWKHTSGNIGKTRNSESRIEFKRQ
ncbi:MAG: FAD-dependent oxidoreductase [Spirochaetales bacterium]|nr:FAD-dependent oxidoreductase [Spirochaetales bacterium]